MRRTLRSPSELNFERLPAAGSLLPFLSPSHPGGGCSARPSPAIPPWRQPQAASRTQKAKKKARARHAGGESLRGLRAGVSLLASKRARPREDNDSLPSPSRAELVRMRPDRLLKRPSRQGAPQGDPPHALDFPALAWGCPRACKLRAEMSQRASLAACRVADKPSPLLPPACPPSLPLPKAVQPQAAQMEWKMASGGRSSL